MGPTQSRSVCSSANPTSVLVFRGPPQCLCACLKTLGSWQKEVYSQSECSGRVRAPKGMILSPWAQEISAGPWDFTDELRGPTFVTTAQGVCQNKSSTSTMKVHLQRPKHPRGVPCHSSMLWGAVHKPFWEIFWGFFSSLQWPTS